MEQYSEIIHAIALTLGASWASGINLYAALVMLGLLANTGNAALPPDLQILADPRIIGAAGFMYIVEFFADKVPGVDTGWDTVHTFIRIPAGALLAYGATSEIDPGLAVAAAIVGGTISAGSHGAKAGSRVLINTSPEPFTNWFASVGEDVVVVAGLWTALFIVFVIWLLPKIWRGIKKVFGFIVRLFSDKQPPPAPAELPPAPGRIDHQPIEEKHS